MHISILQIIILAVVQGLAELLPVSSSAHVIVTEKIMGLDPTTSEMTFLLVMLHTGTMFAVIAYFWKAWKRTFFPSVAVFKMQAARLIFATLLTGAIGYPLMKGIEFTATKTGYITNTTGEAKDVEIEDLFGDLRIISISLAVVGVLIIVAGLSEKSAGTKDVGLKQAGWIGAIQGLCLPFRGFSRSGATISTGMLLGSMKARVEEFSFALAVILTPAVVAKEGWRLIKNKPTVAGEGVVPAPHPLHLGELLAPGLLGLVLSFLAGLVALKLLSKVLEKGRWHLFGFYCICFAILALAMYLKSV